MATVPADLEQVTTLPTSGLVSGQSTGHIQDTYKVSRALQAVLAGWSSLSASGHTHAVADLTDATDITRTFLKSATVAAARTAIGAQPVGSYATLVNGVVPAAQLPPVSATPGSNEQVLILSRPGALAIGPGQARLPLPVGGEIVSAVAALGVPGSGPTTVGINVNGGDVFSSPSQRPTVAARASTSGFAPVGRICQPGDYLTVDVTRIGPTSPATSPYVVATTAVTSDDQRLTVNRPSGSAVGDVHILQLFTSVGGAVGATGQPTTAVTAPSGWQPVSGSPTRNQYTSSDRSRDMHVLYWVDNGSQSSFTFDMAQPTSLAYAKATLITVRGAKSGGPFENTRWAAPAASSTTWEAPASPVTAGSLVLHLYGSPRDVSTPSVTGDTLLPQTNTTLVAAWRLVDADGTAPATNLTGTTSSTSRFVTATLTMPATASTGTTQDVTPADLTVALRYRAAAT